MHAYLSPPTTIVMGAAVSVKSRSPNKVDVEPKSSSLGSKNWLSENELRAMDVVLRLETEMLSRSCVLGSLSNAVSVSSSSTPIRSCVLGSLSNAVSVSSSSTPIRSCVLVHFRMVFQCPLLQRLGNPPGFLGQLRFRPSHLHYPTVSLQGEKLPGNCHRLSSAWLYSHHVCSTAAPPPCKASAFLLAW